MAPRVPFDMGFERDGLPGQARRTMPRDVLGVGFAVERIGPPAREHLLVHNLPSEGEMRGIENLYRIRNLIGSVYGAVRIDHPLGNHLPSALQGGGRELGQRAGDGEQGNHSDK